MRCARGRTATTRPSTMTSRTSTASPSGSASSTRTRRTRTLPQLEIVRFPRDHTNGTRAGSATPSAMVADNDLAVGQLVDAISHSPDWPSTAIFVIEDDAQNGPDHVDEQRAPFCSCRRTRRAASSTRPTRRLPCCARSRSCSGCRRCRRTTPARVPLPRHSVRRRTCSRSTRSPREVDLKATNPKTAYRAADSARLDFADADRVDDGVLNDILWHAVKGVRATPPPFGEFRGPTDR